MTVQERPADADGLDRGGRRHPLRARGICTRCLPPLLRSPLRPRVLVVNSSSGRRHRRAGRDRWVPRRWRCRAGHSTTASPASWRAAGSARAIVVMLTPRRLSAAGRLPRAAHRGRCAAAAPPSPMAGRCAGTAAGLLERAGREFNYPADSHAPQRWPTGPSHGSYTRFCSNACAAWSNAALDAIGGFKPTLVSEETIAVAELLARGERIAYVAEAVVEHAHPLRPRRRVPPPVRHRLQPPHLRLAAAARARATRRAAARFAAEVLRTRAARGSRAELPTASWPSSRRAGSAIAPGLAGPSPAAWRWRSRLSGQDYFWTSDVAWPAAAPWRRCEPWRMRLAFLTNNRFPPREGIGRHVLEVAHRLQAARPRPSPCWRAVPRSRPGRRAAVAGLQVRHYPALSGAAVPPRAGRVRELAGWLRDGADGAELLHVHLPLLPPLPDRPADGRDRSTARCCHDTACHRRAGPAARP